MLYHKRDFLPPSLSVCSLLWGKAADTMEKAQRLRVGTSHAEDLGLVSSTHQVAPNCLSLHFPSGLLWHNTTMPTSCAYTNIHMM